MSPSSRVIRKDPLTKGEGAPLSVKSISHIRARVPFLRWSFIRMFLPLPRDNREDLVLREVLENAEKNNLDEVIRVIDNFGHSKRYLINVGDEKGQLLDVAIERSQPTLLLELGTYIGYSALRTARAMPPSARLVSVELREEYALIARQILDHAGVGDRVTVVVGKIGDQATMNVLRRQGFTSGSLDFMFIDHFKAAYLPDLQEVLTQGWLHPGSVVVADNIKRPGAPDYSAYMHAEEGKTWRTVSHDTHAEYQKMLKDVVMESEYLGEAAGHRSISAPTRR